MPPTGPTPNHGVGKGLERVLQFGLELARQARESSAGPRPPSRERQMALEHRAALVRHEAELRRHEGRIAGARAGAVAGGVGTVAMGAATLGSLGASPGQAAAYGALAAVSAALGLRSRSRARELSAHRPVPRIPPPPPARLRPGARGAQEADRVAKALMQVYDLLPSIAVLSPAAGQELWRAVGYVEPLLRGQVERLASLDRVEWEMPGSRAARAAGDAAVVVAGRLTTGADALEELVTAAVAVLAAPDLGDAVPDVIGPAIMSLEAFAHGLSVADAARSTEPWR